MLILKILWIIGFSLSFYIIFFYNKKIEINAPDWLKFVFCIIWPLPVIYMVIDIFIQKHKMKQKRKAEIAEKIRKEAERSKELTRKLRSNEVPSDEDIKKYYKMYCIKFKMDRENASYFTTYEESPMSFDIFEKQAKDTSQFGGWRFLIGNVSDAFMGDGTIYRFRDYESMIDDDTTSVSPSAYFPEGEEND